MGSSLFTKAGRRRSKGGQFNVSNIANKEGRSRCYWTVMVRLPNRSKGLPFVSVLLGPTLSHAFLSFFDPGSTAKPWKEGALHLVGSLALGRKGKALKNQSIVNFSQALGAAKAVLSKVTNPAATSSIIPLRA